MTFPIAVDLVVTSKSFLVRPLSASYLFGVCFWIYCFFILKLEGFHCSLENRSFGEKGRMRFVRSFLLQIFHFN